MTRINLVPAFVLTDQHLMAEIHELPRIWTYTVKHPGLHDLPKKFLLGTGHVRFFKNKLGFLHERYCSLLEEAQKRKISVSIQIPASYSVARIQLYEKHFEKYVPTSEDICISLARLVTKIVMKPNWYKYYGQRLPKHMLEFYGVRQ